MVIFMTVAFHRKFLMTRSSACGAIPVTPSYILYRFDGKLRARAARCGAHYSVQRQMRYDRRVMPHPAMTQGDLRHARKTS
jgi:hypothetical protein